MTSFPTAAPAVRGGLGLLAELRRGHRRDAELAAELDAGLRRVEVRLDRMLRFDDALADVSGRYLLGAGGKRVRPLLALLTAQLGRGATDQVVKAATAIEITHLASLYHDDVMDDATSRRGVPSANMVWSNSVAILTGDLLFSSANQLMAELGDRAIRMQAETFRRLVIGQLHETIGPSESDDPEGHYLEVLRDKTGSLIAAAARSGAVFSDADPAYEQPLVDYGERVGVAFQLADDVLDLAPTAVSGKTPGADLRSGVVTMPLLLLRRYARVDPASADLLSRIDRHLAEGRERPHMRAIRSVDPLDAVLEELRRHPVVDETLAEARRWSRSAMEVLAPLPHARVRRALVAFASGVVNRSR